MLLADDHPLLLAAVSELLVLSGGFTIVATCHDGAEVVAAARASTPDVAVLDVTMGRVDGLSATRHLRAELPGVRVVVLTAATGAGVVADARRSGASGLVVKGSAPSDLPDHLRRVVAGGQVWPALPA